MEGPYIVVILALMTLTAVIAFALRSKQKTQERMNDEAARKSTLAADKSSTGRPADV